MVTGKMPQFCFPAQMNSSSNMIETSHENTKNCIVVCFIGCRRYNLNERTPLILIMSSMYHEMGIGSNLSLSSAELTFQIALNLCYGVLK